MTISGTDVADVGFNLLTKMQQQFGFEAYVFVIPGFDNPLSAYRWKGLHERAAKTVQNYPTINYADLLPRFGMANPDLTAFAADPIHPNVAGHQLIAEAILDTLRKKSKATIARRLGK